MPSTDSAAGKRRQRARNKAAGGESRSGSSGVLERIRETDLLSFEQAQEMGAEHLGDLMFAVQHLQITVDGSGILTVAVPPAWVHRAVDLHQRSRVGLCFVRAFGMAPIRTPEEA